VKLHQKLFHKACMEKTSKIRLNITAKSFVLDSKIVNMCPEPFLQNLQAKNFENASELQGKQHCFWTQKL